MLCALSAFVETTWTLILVVERAAWRNCVEELGVEELAIASVR